MSDASFSDIVDQLKQNNRSEVDQLKENNTSEVEQLKKNNRSEAGRDGRHTMALNEINTTLGGQTTNLMELAEIAKSSGDVPPTELKPKTIEDEETDDKNKSLAQAITNSKVFKGISGVLGKVGGFLGGLLKGVADKGKGLLGTLFKVAGLGLLIAFLNSDTFKNFFSEENIKNFQNSVANFIDKTKKVFNAFFGEDGSISKGLEELGIDGAAILASAILALGVLFAPDLVLFGLKTAIKLLVTSLPGLFTGLFTTVIPFITGVLGKIAATISAVIGAPLLPIIAIAAAIGLVIASIANAFTDFKTTLDETGSIWEASKAGIISFFSNLLGLPFDLIKMGISWVIGKVGDIFGIESFQNASKVLDDFSFVDSLKEIFGSVFDYIGSVLDAMGTAIFSGIESAIRSIPTVEIFGKKFGGGALADKLFGAEDRVKPSVEPIVEAVSKEERDKNFNVKPEDTEENSVVRRVDQRMLRFQQKAKERELEPVGMSSGAMGGGAVTIVNSVNKGGDSTTNMTSTSESLVNNALTGTPDFAFSP